VASFSPADTAVSVIAVDSHTSRSSALCLASIMKWHSASEPCWRPALSRWSPASLRKLVPVRAARRPKRGLTNGLPVPAW